MMLLGQLILIPLLVGIAVADKNVSPQSKVTSVLLEGYDTDALPVLGAEDSVPVTLGATLITIDDVDQISKQSGVITLNVWLNLSWEDKLLTWDPEAFSGVKSIRLSPKRLWMPDIRQYNSLDIHDDIADTKVVVDHTGHVLWVPPTRLRSMCHRQKGVTWACTMKFGSWTYSGEAIDLGMQGNGFDLTSMMASDTWKIGENESQRNVVKYDCCPESYIDITYNITLAQRNSVNEV
jgi:hypothetical protein